MNIYMNLFQQLGNIYNVLHTIFYMNICSFFNCDVLRKGTFHSGLSSC